MPACFSHPCSRAATIYHTEKQRYYCDQHFDLKFLPEEGARLVKSELVKTKLNSLEKAITIYKVFMDSEEDLTDTHKDLYLKVSQSLTELRQQVQIDLRDQANAIKKEIDTETEFSEFTKEFFWSLTNEDSTGNKNSKTPQILLQEKSEEIERFQEELKQKEAHIEDLENENKKLQKIIQAKPKLTMTIEEFNALFQQEVGSSMSICSVSEIGLELRDEKYMQFLSKIDRTAPNIKTLRLDYVPPENQVVMNFLQNYLPKKLEGFEFNYGPKLSDGLDYYINDILAIAPHVKNDLMIYCYEISQENLISLFSAAKNKKKLGFECCKLDLSTSPDLKSVLSGCTIEKLDFSSCGSYGNFPENPNHMSNLLKALAESPDLRKSLKEIKTMNWGFNTPEITKILLNWGFEDIKVVNYYY
ncbi:unnamed protein product [Moneuplotes crassus]|uniref:Uncharacterized protein n=1 Tax=Euplotes crassus TaxID=5936 RepID=A0AAD1UII9_EUPCR|nr:unnamed protein product [Moneuplotes crassus]